MKLKSLLLIGSIVTTAIALAPNAQASDNFVGLGFKGEGNNNLGIMTKVDVLSISDTASLAARTDLYLGDSKPEIRPTITLNGDFNEKLTGFIGGGLNVDFDGDDSYSGVVNGGLDIKVSDDLVVTTGLDYLTADKDLQGKIGLGFRF
jgi:hypothetical protein